MEKLNEEQPGELNKTNQYHLSIRFSSDGFDLLVLNEFKTVLSSKKVSVSLYSLSSSDIVKLLTQELLLNYQSVQLICESDQYTFIPASLFKEEAAADFLNVQFKPAKSDLIVINHIPKWDTVNVFSIPKTLYEALNQFFPNVEPEHHLSVFLKEKIKLQNGNSVYISVRTAIMDVVVIKEGGLQLINSYTFNSPEDFTYYTLNLFDKLPLDTENCNVILFNGSKKPELQKTLELYLEVKNGIND